MGARVQCSSRCDAREQGQCQWVLMKATLVSDAELKRPAQGSSSLLDARFTGVCVCRVCTLCQRTRDEVGGSQLFPTFYCQHMHGFAAQDYLLQITGSESRDYSTHHLQAADFHRWPILYMAPSQLPNHHDELLRTTSTWRILNFTSFIPYLMQEFFKVRLHKSILL